MGTLILASKDDQASLNLLSSVIDLGCWGESTEFEHGSVWAHINGDVHILLIDEIHILADGIDKKHEKLTKFKIDDILILSRHVSSSKTPALTLHPIGIPGGVPHGERGVAGGINGKLSPPSPRFAPLFRIMREIAIERAVDDRYDITIEATHHGPLLSKPTIYVEIGSDEDQWNDKEAADVWAQAISISLGLTGGEQHGLWQGQGEVLLGIGGGHYAPRHKSVIRDSEVWAGHIIASYSLDFDNIDERPEVSNHPWKNSLGEALTSTIQAFPGGAVFAHLDRKSFKGWQRAAIIEELEMQGIPVKRGNDIVKKR